MPGGEVDPPQSRSAPSLVRSDRLASAILLQRTFCGIDASCGRRLARCVAQELTRKCLGRKVFARLENDGDGVVCGRGDRGSGVAWALAAMSDRQADRALGIALDAQTVRRAYGAWEVESDVTEVRGIKKCRWRSAPESVQLARACHNRSVSDPGGVVAAGHRVQPISDLRANRRYRAVKIGQLFGDPRGRESKWREVRGETSMLSEDAP